jgi:hypothetical protein
MRTHNSCRSLILILSLCELKACIGVFGRSIKFLSKIVSMNMGKFGPHAQLVSTAAHSFVNRPQLQLQKTSKSLVQLPSKLLLGTTWQMESMPWRSMNLTPSSVMVLT